MIVVMKQPAEPLTAFDGTGLWPDALSSLDQSVVQALVVSFVVVMLDELVDCSAQRRFSEEDHAVQAGFLDRSYESLRESVQVWGTGRQPNGLDTLLSQEITESVAEQGVAVHDQVARVKQEAFLGVGDVASDLLDPFGVGMWRDAGNVDSARREPGEEQHEVPRQTFQLPHFDGDQVRSCNGMSVRLQEGRPALLRGSAGGMDRPPANLCAFSTLAPYNTPAM